MLWDRKSIHTIHCFGDSLTFGAGAKPFVLGLILIVMLVGTVYLQHLLGRIHYVDSGTAPTLSPEV